MADVPAWKQALIRAREEKARQAEAASKQGDVVSPSTHFLSRTW